MRHDGSEAVQHAMIHGELPYVPNQGAPSELMHCELMCRCGSVIAGHEKILPILDPFTIHNLQLNLSIDGDWRHLVQAGRVYSPGKTAPHRATAQAAAQFNR